jgi:hypothetical protein
MKKDGFKRGLQQCTATNNCTLSVVKKPFDIPDFEMGQYQTSHFPDPTDG